MKLKVQLHMAAIMVGTGTPLLSFHKVLLGSAVLVAQLDARGKPWTVKKSGDHLQKRPLISAIATSLFKNKNLQKCQLVSGMLEDVSMRKQTPRGGEAWWHLQASGPKLKEASVPWVDYSQKNI